MFKTYKLDKPCKRHRRRNFTGPLPNGQMSIDNSSTAEMNGTNIFLGENLMRSSQLEQVLKNQYKI